MNNIFFNIYSQAKLWIKAFSLATLFSLPHMSVAQTNAVSNNVLTEKINDSAKKEKLKVWEKRANAGDREAQFRLALYYDLSSQVNDKDILRSIYWYELAAKQGHTLAQYNLGAKFLKGEGISKNVNKAMSLWLLSANAGHMQSQFNIGRAYFLGVGLEEDQQKAKFWFQKAAIQGDPKSRELLKKIDLSNVEQIPIIDSAKPPTNKTQSAQVSRHNKVEKNINPALGHDNKIVERSLGNINAPINVYSGPYKHNQFIMQLPDRMGMSIVEKRNKNWFKVALKSTIPVWVNEKYLLLQGSQQKDVAIVRQEGVYARSVPQAIKGSVLGFFEQGEQVISLDKKGNWHKVSPTTRFDVWVKRKDWVAK